MPLLILDRDGVINAESDEYIRGVRDWQPLPGSIKAIADLTRAGYRIAVATNQSGLGRGYFSLDDLEAVNALMHQTVEQAGGQLACICYCPHRPDEGCACRKPATGLLQAIERELGEPVRGAYFIGDSMKDLQAAESAKCQPVLVLTGRGRDTQVLLQAADCPLENPAAVAVHEDLARAAQAILSR